MTSHTRPDHEFEFIDRVTSLMKATRPDQTLVSFGDDGAVYRPTPGKAQVLTVDMLVEGVHFTRQTMSPVQIGHKALAVNLSDLAAMGAVPAYFLISIGVAEDWTEKALQDIYVGMSRLAAAHRIDLIGGDTVTSPRQLVISITAVGEADTQNLPLRSRARPGHIVFVTGKLGLAAAGLHLLLQENVSQQEKERFAPLLKAHQEPDPHVQQGQLIVHLAQDEPVALNDVSDGLASEANEIAQASGVDLVLEKKKLPTSRLLLDYAQLQGVDPYDWILTGGEDFVLTGTIAPELFARLNQAFRHQGFPLYEIGRVVSGSGQVWLDDGGKIEPLKAMGYNHFKKRGGSP